jgi:tetratricopeptide (TPR) repeat protein
MKRAYPILRMLAAVCAWSGCATNQPPPSEDAHSLVELGRAAAKSGNHQVAVSYYTRAVIQDPDNAEAYNERGKSNVQLRLSMREAPENRDARETRILDQNALDDFTTAVRKNSSYSEAYYNRAMILASRAQYKSAVSDLLSVVQFSPQDPEPHRWLGDLYETKFEDRTLKAMEHYEKYVDLGGTDPGIREKVRGWKELRKKAAPPSPPTSLKPATAEDELKAAELHSRAMELIQKPDKAEALTILDSLLTTYSNTKYVQEKMRALQALLSVYRRKDAQK